MGMVLRKTLKDAQKAYTIERIKPTTKVSVKAAEVVETAKEEPKKNNFLGLIILVAVIALSITMFAVSCDKTSDKSEGNAMFLQVAGNNDKNRVDGDFEKKYAAAVKDAANLSEAQKKLILNNSANNAQRLAIWSSAFGLYNDPNDITSLLTSDKKYLSEKGEGLYYKLEGALSACILKEGKAPSNGYNSGVSKGNYVAAKNSGVSGNRKAIVATMPNGDKVYIMVRCGNVVTPSKPHVPVGPTDQLEPKDPTKDVLANPNVDGWKKNSNGEKAVAEPDSYQADPAKDAAKAAADAKVAADKAAAAADDARKEATNSGAGVVDSGTGYGEVPDPTVIDPNW